MNYDFTTILDRRGRDCIAADWIPVPGAQVDEGVDPIPMWVADMSFPIAPCIREALHQRIDYPFFGYFPLSGDYHRAILDWHRTHKPVPGLEKEHLGYENGVLGGVSTAIQLLTTPGEPILLHAPTYVGFTHVLENTGRVAVHSDLKRDEAGIWRMDYEDMDRKLKEHNIHLAIFCSPHNPTGRVWERREIERAMEVYAENQVTVISDEIWSDLILPGHTHIPTQAVSEDAKARTLAFYSPSKSFSLAGLVGSYHVVFDPALKARMDRQAALTHYNSPNMLSMHALIAAYDRGGPWLEELCRVLDQNMAWACDFISEHFPGVRVMRPQGTYMLFLDCGDWCRDHGVPIGQLLGRGVKAGVIWQNGEDFFWPSSIRMNLALPHQRMKEAFRRLEQSAFV